ncbi:MAG TPA: HD domain-containing phosphohydrolase [Anaerolineales bacterium]|nr:HD domain-containing phosphohydrolase [Anaerolineales bacterium]
MVLLSHVDSALEAVQAFADLVFLLESDGTILDCKIDESVIPSQSASSLVRKKIQQVVPSDLAEMIERHLIALRQPAKIIPFEFSLPAPDHQRWYEAQVSFFPPSGAILLARDITAHKLTQVRMQQQLRQLSALRSIDLGIASGLDLKLLLSMLLDQVTALLHIDAACVLLLNHETNFLQFSSGKGFKTGAFQSARLKVGEGFAGRVALERRMINIANLAGASPDPQRSELITEERFVSYYGVPLVAKGRTLGILEVFHRSPLYPDADWLEFLNIISGQAAIAIDSAMMSRELQRSNVELGLAYDAAIDGWARTLDLRDKQPEGYTRQVAELTVRLATNLGVENKNVVHIRRGAILHDIGKVAIPDEILFKEGPLTGEEWEIMRRHPSIAVELLSPISHLNPALEIPRCHHEKWDGTGYPDHLHGDQIPFAARLFALADVYNALITDRPYRRAWTRQDAVQYIQNESGRHFDPRMVPEFLKLVNENLHAKVN